MSNYKELEFALEKYNFDFVQAPFNLLDQGIVTSGWYEKLKKNNIEIHIRSIFLQGLLLIDRKNIPKQFEKWSSIWDKYEDWCKINSISKIETCINVIKKYNFDNVIIGVNNMNQLRTILKKIKLKKINLSPDIVCNDNLLINPSKWNIYEKNN